MCFSKYTLHRTHIKKKRGRDLPISQSEVRALEEINMV